MSQPDSRILVSLARVFKMRKRSPGTALLVLIRLALQANWLTFW